MKMPDWRGFFVTGTDTGVGKTVVAAALLAALRSRGIRAAPMKPVQTGARLCRGELQSPDLEFCLRVNGVRPDCGLKRRMAPHLFREACSPHLAARRASRAISVSGIKKAFQALHGPFDAVVVEGAGGLFVPLSRQSCMVDLIQALGLPVVLVARPGLGTLNHTLLSLEALRRRGLGVFAVVLNPCSEKPNFIEADNMQTLARFAGRRRVLAFPRLRAADFSPAVFRQAASRVFGPAISHGTHDGGIKPT